jgi:hypothetical protein
VGDYLGHPFRGNQHENAAQAGSASTPASGVSRGDYLASPASGPVVKVPQGHTLNNPIKGSVPGTAIIGYEWKSMIADVESKTEGTVAKRVSDWDASGFSTGTGREIVHHFYVKHPDGSVTLEGVRSAEKILGGITDKTTLSGVTSAVKTARGWEAKIAEAEATLRNVDAVEKEVDAVPQPPITVSERGWRMGDAEVWHPSFAGAKPADIPEERKRSLIEDWRRNEARRRGADLLHASSLRIYVKEYRENLKKAMKKVEAFMK